MPRHGRNTGQWVRTRAKVLAGRPDCALCGKPIDYDGPYRDERGKLNPWGPVVDHIEPMAKGGNPYDLGNLQAAHRRCNGRKGDRARPRTVTIPKLITSRDW